MIRSRVTIPLLVIVIAAAIGIFVATSGGGTKTAEGTIAPGSAISLAQTSLGKMLVDANGRTLYLFEGDRPNVSTLSAAGRAIWPPFTSTVKPAAAGGAIASQIGTLAGAGGTTQVTYNGHPLYYYVGDQKPGQTAGQGLNQFGGLWYVLSAQGQAITSAGSSAASGGSAGTGSSAGAGSSYGY